MADGSEAGGGEEPIIIKKGKKGGDAPHGGAWKVAYADFVTAMMALFIVLWILGQSEEVKQSVSGYFQDPIGFKAGGGKSIIDIGSGKDKGKYDTPPGGEATEEDIKALETKRLSQMGNDIKESLSKSAEFQNIAAQVEFEVVDEGLRIEIMDSQSDAFFQIGTAELRGGADKMLGLIGAELGKLNNKIAVEGHTDARPFPGGAYGYSNYELSCDRANAARRSLLKGGLNVLQIEEIKGWADKRLRMPQDPNNVINRRISIIVKYSENL
ncbi:MAG: OmpA family protein [Melioribacteraceae bacterium]|nr:OmpA family protein [Melioribacteraceae bacterium]